MAIASASCFAMSSPSKRHRRSSSRREHHSLKAARTKARCLMRFKRANSTDAARRLEILDAMSDTSLRLEGTEVEETEGGPPVAADHMIGCSLKASGSAWKPPTTLPCNADFLTSSQPPATTSSPKPERKERPLTSSSMANATWHGSSNHAKRTSKSKAVARTL